MRTKKKGEKWMAIKLDLEKDYDIVNWEFIGVLLRVVRILDFISSVIMKVISLSTMQILWNGVPTQKFKSSKGIRQGCSLSPYLFVLCMEWLGHIIHDRNFEPLL